jgi:hypothetical protein
MWSVRDRERSTEEHLRRIRDGAPLPDRPKEYWLFVAIVVIVVLVVLLILR